MAKSQVKIEGNKISIIPQGPGGIEGMGAGEKQLRSLFGGLGLPPEELGELMDNFIEPTGKDKA